MKTVKWPLTRCSGRQVCCLILNQQTLHLWKGGIDVGLLLTQLQLRSSQWECKCDWSCWNVDPNRWPSFVLPAVLQLTKAAWKQEIWVFRQIESKSSFSVILAALCQACITSMQKAHFRIILSELHCYWWKNCSCGEPLGYCLHFTWN